jgi:hypothetical protein
VILSTGYAVILRLLSLPALLLRRDVYKDSELLVLRHENAVLHRQSWQPAAAFQCEREVAQGTKDCADSSCAADGEKGRWSGAL